MGEETGSTFGSPFFTLLPLPGPGVPRAPACLSVRFSISPMSVMASILIAVVYPMASCDSRVYGRQRNDHELELWASAIKIRASRRIGEISAALPKVKTGGAQNGKKGGKIVLPPSGSSKASTLKAAGLTVQAAHRCEQIASIPEAEFEQAIAARAREFYDRQAKERQKLSEGRGKKGVENFPHLNDSRWTQLPTDIQRKVKTGAMSVGEANALFDQLHQQDSGKARDAAGKAVGVSGKIIAPIRRVALPSCRVLPRVCP